MFRIPIHGIPPVIYEARRERQLVWEEYERELESESEGLFSEEVAQGKPIRVPVKLPAEGETITYETGTVPAKGRLRR